MPSITITISVEVAADFATLAKERGYSTGKAFLIALVKGELAHWRATKKAAQAGQDEMSLLEGEIS